MTVWKLFLGSMVVCLIFFVQACASQATPSRRAGPTETTWVSGDLHEVTPTWMKAETATATAEIVALPNAPLTVYAKGGAIWLSGAGHPPQPLTISRADAASIDSSPKISDDGKVIVFLRDGNLWAMDADGGHQRTLAPARPIQFDFSPHSHTLYLTIEAGLAKIDADLPALQLLLDTAQAGAHFVFSPDGSKIALLHNNKIDVVNADGSGLKTVFRFPAVMMATEFSYLPEVIWLPDGSGFKTVIPDPTAPSRFMFISADGKIVARLAEFSATLALANRPFISPDGSRVVYTKAHGVDLELHIIDASTADQIYFSHAAETFGMLGWTPDSAHVVYWADSHSKFWLGPQGDALKLGDARDIAHLTWVDGQHYLFVTNTDELHFAVLGQPSVLLDVGLDESAFDFTTVH